MALGKSDLMWLESRVWGWKGSQGQGPRGMELGSVGNEAAYVLTGVLVKSTPQRTFYFK